jgi:hypothetical protein
MTTTSPGPTCRLCPPSIDGPLVLGPTSVVTMTLSDATARAFAIVPPVTNVPAPSMM